MISNYFKIAIRHLNRNKTYVLINMIGMGIAIAWCILAFANYQFVAQADRFHNNEEKIFRVLRTGLGQTNAGGRIEGALMPAAIDKISQVEDGVRYTLKSGVMKYNDKLFNETVRCVDPNFLDVFSFPLISGDPVVLKDPSNVILSDDAAKKYFGNADPIGQVISAFPGTPWQTNLVVGGVAAPLPKNSCFGFDFLTHISFTEKGERRDTVDSWKDQVEAIFLVLNGASQSAEVAQSLSQFIPIQNEKNTGDKTVKYHLQAMSEVYKNELRINNNSLRVSAPSVAVWGLGIIALLILLTACLNFTNTTISFSNKRLKEMGVRKVMGGGRLQLVYQLLGESFLLCLFAMAIGLLIAQILVPWYNSLWAYMALDLSLTFADNPQLWIFLGIVLFVTTLLGGAYPALYISGFNPTQIFRGRNKFGGDNWMVKSLLGLQIVIALVTIIGSLAFAQNMVYQKNMDLGYDKDGVINVRINGEEQYRIFGNAIRENPAILGVAGSQNNLGFGNWWNPVGKTEDANWTQVQLVGEDFIEVMGFNLLEGRTFNKEIDLDKSVIVNEHFIQEQHGKAKLNETIEMYGKDYTIIGIVKDFVPSSFFDPMSPNVFHYKAPDFYRTLKVKTKPDQMIVVNDFLKSTWAKNFPMVPFESYYQDELMAETLTVSENVSKLFLILSFITLLLSATGLFALVSLNLLKRAKEIAIRRVLGASTKEISYTINRDYVILFSLCGIIGGFAGAYFAQVLLDAIFNIYDGLNSLYIVLAVMFMLLVGFLTIGGRMLTVLRSNPAEVLKSE